MLALRLVVNEPAKIGLVLVLTIAACDNGVRAITANGGNGGAPAGATGGAAGGGGPGGGGGPLGGNGGGPLGGSGGQALPNCSSFAGGNYLVRAQMSDGTPVAASTAAAVVVASVATCADQACGYGVPAPASRVVVTDGASSWTLVVNVPDLPADLLQTGAAFDLTIDSFMDTVFTPTLNQTVVLARAGKLILFGTKMSKFGVAPLPSGLGSYGLSFADQGAICDDQSTMLCRRRVHALRVSFGSATADLIEPATAQVGSLTVSVGSFEELRDTGNCDTKADAIIVAVATP